MELYWHHVFTYNLILLEVILLCHTHGMLVGVAICSVVCDILGCRINSKIIIV